MIRMTRKISGFSTILPEPRIRHLDGFTDIPPAGEVPGIWEPLALERLHRLDAAVASFQKNAGSVRLVNEGESVAGRTQAGVFVDEIPLIHAEVRGNGRDVPVAHFDKARPATTIRAALAEIVFHRKNPAGRRTGLLFVNRLIVEKFFLGDGKRGGLEVELLEKTALIAGVAGSGGLLDLEKQHILVAIHKPAHYFLRVSAGLSLEPEFLPRAAPVGHQTRFQRQGEGLAVHPGKHQDAACRARCLAGFLHDDGDEPVRSKFKIKFHRIALDQILR